MPDRSRFDEGRSRSKNHERSMLRDPQPTDSDSQSHKLRNRIECRDALRSRIGTEIAFPVGLYRERLMPRLLQSASIPAIGKLHQVAVGARKNERDNCELDEELVQESG